VLDPLFIALSVIGYAGLVWVALAPALALWTKKPVLAVTATTALCVWTSDLLATGLKEVFDRPRPFEALAAADPIMRGTVGESLPSGHATTSFAGALVLAYLVRRAIPALFVLAVLISFSRVYVGVHYPLDLAAGAALGSAVALATIAWLRARRRTSADPLLSEARPPPG
jgi:undecaprenyl-diphosphatase